MKKFLFIALSLILSSPIVAQEGIGTDLPDKSSALEIKSEQRGLLIPRITLPDLETANPVQNPTNSLLIYNTGDETEAGFYYWRADNSGDFPDNGFWVRVADGENDLFLEEGEGIKIDDLPDDRLRINLDHAHGEGVAGAVLMTEINDQDTVTVWADMDNLLNGKNGLHTAIENDSTVVKMGGALVEETTVDAEAYDFIFENLGEENNPDSVLVMDDRNALKTMAISEFKAQVNAENGIHKEGDTLKLGGNLTKTTEIDFQDDEETIHELHLKNMQKADTVNKIIVNQDEEGEGGLRTVTRSISVDVDSDYSIESDLNNYTTYVQEINITVDVIDLNDDIDITLPSEASDGQIINVELNDSGGNGEADHYLNIMDDGDEIAYGALPFQTWIVKYNGDQWYIASN